MISKASPIRFKMNAYGVAAASIVWTFAALLAVPTIDARAVFLAPESMVGYESPLCVNMAENLPRVNVTNKTLIVSVDKDICGEATEESRRKYNDTVIYCYDLRTKCDWGAFDTLIVKNDVSMAQAEKHGAVSCIHLWSDPNQVKAIPWLGVYWFGYHFKGKTFPSANCQFVEPVENSGRKGLAGFYIKNTLREAQAKNLSARPRTGLRISLSLDPNPYLPILNSPWWFAYHRIGGGFYVYCAVDAARALRERLKIGLSDAKIPEMMLVIEGLSLFACGVQIILYGCWDTDMPSFFGIFVQRLLGASLSTSLLAGIYFKDLKRSIVEMEMNQGKKFWKKKRAVVIGVAAFFIGVDAFIYYSILYGLRFFATAMGLAMFLGQLLCAVAFVKDTNSFLTTVIGTLESNGKRKKTEDRQYLKLIQMAKMLRISAVAMFLVTIQLLLSALSGGLYEGFQGPNGFAVFSIFGIILRLVPSWAQIQMAKPSSMLKFKAIAKKSKIAQSTRSKGSTTSMASSTGGISSVSASSSSSSSSSSGSSGESSSGSSSGSSAPSSGSSSGH